MKNVSIIYFKIMFHFTHILHFLLPRQNPLPSNTHVGLPNMEGLGDTKTFPSKQTNFLTTVYKTRTCSFTDFRRLSNIAGFPAEAFVVDILNSVFLSEKKS